MTIKTLETWARSGKNRSVYIQYDAGTWDCRVYLDVQSESATTRKIRSCYGAAETLMPAVRESLRRAKQAERSGK